MPERLSIEFAPLSTPLRPAAAVLCALDLTLSPTVQEINDKSGGALLKAAEAASFKGKAKTSIELLAPPRLSLRRMVVIGAGRPSQMKETDWANLGGFAFAQLSARQDETASLIAEIDDMPSRSTADVAADLALGALLRSYRFTKYSTKPRENGMASRNSSSTPPTPTARAPPLPVGRRWATGFFWPVTSSTSRPMSSDPSSSPSGRRRCRRPGSRSRYSTSMPSRH